VLHRWPALGLWASIVPGLVVIWLWNDYGLIVVVLGVAAWLWVSGYWRDVRDWLVPQLQAGWTRTKRLTAAAWRWARAAPKRLWQWIDRRTTALYRRSLLQVQRHSAPFRRVVMRKRGWLSQLIDEETAGARPRSTFGKTFGLDLTRSAPFVVMLLIVVALGALTIGSFALHFVRWHVGLPQGPALGDLYTAMWQVQAGIAALALPVLLFVVERSRDDPRAVFRSPEVLLRDSYAYHIMAFSFMVVAHIGLDIAWFGSSRTVVLLDLVLVGATLLLAMYAYFKVVQLIMSSSLLRDRSIVLAKERLADAAWRTSRRLKGAERLRKEFDAIGVDLWIFEDIDPANQFTVSISTDIPRYIDDVDLTTLRRFLSRLPRQADVDATTDAVLTADPSTATTPAKPEVWYLLGYGNQVSPPETPFLRFRRDAFDNLDEASIASVVNACVHLKANDDL
jgi:hypothetical protein